MHSSTTAMRRKFNKGLQTLLFCNSRSYQVYCNYSSELSIDLPNQRGFPSFVARGTLS
jgi:hypothetical protein